NENSRLSLEWNEKRLFTKINYKIHTDAVKEHLEPVTIGAAQKYIYANEADVLNVALFGVTAKQWRDAHENESGNVRDHATLNQLIVLANLESMNAQLLKIGMSRPERAAYLNEMAIQQLESLQENATIRRIEEGSRNLLGR
ncbi:MAG: KilA-N domain-containing protein, partial [Raoultibacter sp.]